MGMKSVTDATAPVDSQYVVSKIKVPGRYRRSIVLVVVGEIDQNPCELLPTSRAKQASESKSGQQSQFSEPHLLINAAVWRSPISA
jgi:hypothetical protein